jgi:hypothetical protein
MPKLLEWWGVKNIFWFSKVLVAKSLWRLTQDSMLWGRVMATKYFSGRSVVDWFKEPIKSMMKFSNVWKEMVKSFPLIREWIVWNVGNCKSIIIGKDPWEGASC